MSDNIKVVVKVRPLIAREVEDKLPAQWRDTNNTLYQLDSNGRVRDYGYFTFDKVYGESTKTADVYEDVAKPIVEAAVEGFNGTIFAYGQTSSGKTYTMTGTEDSPGIIPLAIFNLFDIIKNVPGRDFVVSVSYIEIYNETLKDLLDIEKKIKIHDNYNHGVKVDASTKYTASPEEVIEAMKEGNANRQTGATNMNESSSRSHSIFQIIIESREHIEGEAETGCVNQSQLNLVDLAGSERAGQTGATGLRFKEGTSINKSLTALALVIKQLSDEPKNPNKYVNYRDSKLTRILQNSLGGNAKTSIICAVTPAALEETISTLQFATRAKSIKNKPEVNAVPTDATMIQSLTKQLSNLQSQLETKKNLEVMLESKKNVEQDLQNRIKNLQRFILNGFGQRPNVELMGGVRRKQLPSRRITISTATLEAIEEDAPKVPKFCTPSLKYNPSLIQNPADIVPIQKQGTLASLPEEPLRLITPPPRERKVNFSGDVIELDSDDDEESAPACSPYHSCYDSTKTPPCILRKNAQHAEKSLKEIIELTDREKMYKPDVVELIQKLEQSTAKTAKLQDEIEVLKTASNEKDSELEMLKCKVKITEEEIISLNSLSLELETERKDFNVKLTDWEVSYETLKNKAKLREQELLSLLEEQKRRQVEDIGKLPIKLKEKDIINFLDVSKDISLVNSDNENSIFHQEDDEHTERRNCFMTDMQKQLAEKNITISELENNIRAQKEQVELMEKSSHDLLDQVANFKEKLTYVENENELLQSTVNELNDTVKSLKENLELAQIDMSSYSCVIQELQIKLSNKEKKLDSGYIDDTVLESMLINEDKTIANNENLKNIVHSFKLALENSKKENDLLKMVHYNEAADKDSTEDFNEKAKQIELLNEEIFKLTKQTSEHMVTINNLLRDKNDLARIEQQHVILSEKQASQIELLKSDIAKLETYLAEKCEKNAIELKNNAIQYECQIEKATNKIKILSDINAEQSSEIQKILLELNDKTTIVNNMTTQLRLSQETESRESDENAEKDPFIDTLKENEISLCNKIEELKAEITMLHGLIKNKEEINQTLNEKEETARQRLQEVNDKLQQKCYELDQVKQTLEETEKCNNLLLENIMNRIGNASEYIKEKKPFNKNGDIRDHILALLDTMVEHVTVPSPLEKENTDLKSRIEYMSHSNQSLKADLKHSNELLQHIKEELKLKSGEIEDMKHKVIEWKDQFNTLDMTMKEQTQMLQADNQKIKAQYKILHNETQTKIDLLSSYNNEIYSEKALSKSSRKTDLNVDNLSPPSLLTICCNTIVDAMDPKRNDNMSETTSSSFTGNTYTKSTTNPCIECDQLAVELRTMQQENKEMFEMLEQLKIINRKQLEEQNEIREQVRLLLEPSQELQKKIINHRTNLSILTATTYAENKSLKSQVKGLQHHHSRIHNVCQRDIPEFKKYLNELMVILKDESSFSDRHNSSFKRYSLPDLPESNLSVSQIKNESTCDNDMLMLDTNVTVLTADQTLVGYNHTCLDLTMLNETDSQTKLEMLTEENTKLKEQLAYLAVSASKVDAQCSPVKVRSTDTDSEKKMKEIKQLAEQLSFVTKQREEFEKKYNDLNLEIPSIDALVHKIKTLEEQLQTRGKELSQTTYTLKTKNEELRALQEENDTLSTQIMEHISDIDDLNKEVEIIRKLNIELAEKCKSLELKSNTNMKVDTDQELEPSISKEKHSKLNRSLSDSDTTSRHNKICTLQSEIHAGREDCKVLTEDVATIKHHLDQTNMSMDMDQSINFELANESLPCSPQSKRCIMPDIQEERIVDLYAVDRNSCFNYYFDITGIDKENLPSNMKIIEVMKLLHNNLVAKHGNEVENLVNKLKDYQETQANSQLQIRSLSGDISRIQKDLDQKEKGLNLITNLITQLRNNLILANTDAPKSNDSEVYKQIAGILKDHFLSLLDTHFNLSSVIVFEQITNHTNKLSEDFEKVCHLVSETSTKLSEKEKQCSLLMAQNEKIKEINNAVTLDIVKKEEETINIIRETYQKLLELDMISSDKVPLTEPVDVRILIKLLEHFTNKYQEEKLKEETMAIAKIKATLEEKENQLSELQTQVEILQSINQTTLDKLSEKDDKVIKLERSHEELSAAFNTRSQENDRNLYAIAQLSEEISKLNETIINKEQLISSLSDKDAKATELLHELRRLQDDNEKLKAVNQMISKERESYASELEKSCATIKQNNADITKMTSDILVLRESVNEATNLMEKLRNDAQALEEENILVKQKLEIKAQDCSRLNTNIKTHEKTAEVQSRMIMRLQKQKEEDDKEICEKSKVLEEMNEKHATLARECEELQNTVKTLQEEIETLKIAKVVLENRLSECEETGRKSRTSMDAADASKRRRQSLHDSKRMFDNLEDHKNAEAVFTSRQKNDLFMDVDDDNSDRSTPFVLVKGRDSLLSRTDHSDRDEEHPSRPSSSLAKAARRRRQSSHDLHRSITPQANSPSDLSHYVINEIQQLDTDISRSRLHSDNEITLLREQLATYERELEGLKERNRELDEECEICGEYIQERDQLIQRLKKEKAAIEKEVSALRTKSEPHNFSFAMKPKPAVAHVSVNTDKDWANLHSVVVDRMSYDAEVEKNKKLTKTIEELRFKKLDLMNTIAKMQKALEKSTSKEHSRELDHTKQELKACKEELKELRAKYKELDEECETCSEYLKEREEQCRRLKEAKTALETKLQELQDKAAEHSRSVRRKRQAVHDLNRPETSLARDVSTDTMEDLSSVSHADSTQVESTEASRDVSSLKKRVEILSQQKALLEQQLRSVQIAHPMFVATGSAIVQNQQITDVMKENQKLKKMNAKLVTICKKRGKSANRENEDPCEQN